MLSAAGEIGESWAHHRPHRLSHLTHAEHFVASHALHPVQLFVPKGALRYPQPDLIALLLELAAHVVATLAHEVGEAEGVLWGREVVVVVEDAGTDDSEGVSAGGLRRHGVDAVLSAVSDDRDLGVDVVEGGALAVVVGPVGGALEDWVPRATVVGVGDVGGVEVAGTWTSSAVSSG